MVELDFICAYDKTRNCNRACAAYASEEVCEDRHDHNGKTEWIPICNRSTPPFRIGEFFS